MLFKHLKLSILLVSLSIVFLQATGGVLIGMFQLLVQIVILAIHNLHHFQL